VHHLTLAEVHLDKGSHPSDPDKGCVMEWLSVFAEERTSDRKTDHPKCASPVLTAFAITFNDGLDDANRQRLIPFIPRLVGTSGNTKADNLRAWMAIDWLARTYVPAFLRIAGLTEHADTLAAARPPDERRRGQEGAAISLGGSLGG